MSLPDPGGAICTACGPTGSPAYLSCNAQVAAGIIPQCAAPKGGSVAPQQTGGSTVANTQATNQAAPQTATADPWYCFMLPAGIGGCSGSSGGGSINWADIGIRGGLILFGAIVLLLVVAKSMEKPSVVVEE